MEKSNGGRPPESFSMDDVPLISEAGREEFLKVWTEYTEMLSTPTGYKTHLIYGTGEKEL